MKIHQLDEMIANKIAAGEVVERPASVIKELCENSIDAHATHIDVIVKDGGCESMVVIDDGDGMDQEDALMCFNRHATSKITNDSDLFAIMTLGFRGEAIPSIAAISEFTLETCDGGTPTKVVHTFGKRTSVGTCALNRGTKITVERIFQNVPARLKYLRSVNAEFAAIYTFIERLSLSHPEIAFTLVHNDRQIFKTSGSGQLLEVIAEIYGLNVAKNMVKVDMGNEEFHLTGYISKIDTSRASKNHIITLVNGRYVRHMKTINTINDVYRRYLPEKRYPIVVINIEVDPYLVDVNVHPAKLEVRFSKEDLLNQIIEEGLNTALKQVDLTYQPQNRVTERSFKPQLSAYDSPSIGEREPLYQAEQMTFNFDTEIKETVTPSVEEVTFRIEETIHDMRDQTIKQRPIQEKIYAKGQVRGTYIIGENERGMFLADQHAAQERINYEKFRAQYSRLDLAMRPLIVPLTYEYPESECLILEERKEHLEKVGIHLEAIGRHSYIVRELPVWMEGIDEKVFVDEMIQEVLSHDHLDVVKLRDLAIATLACKASLKGNTYLTLDEIQTIFDGLMRCENPYVCPHGRPTLIFYSDYELDKLFKRVML